MLDTSKWQELNLAVLSGVHLDPKNVRLDIATPQVEADIIGDLFANEATLDLVVAISKVGYLTHETPIVVKRDGKYVVVEGNRRLSALKAIQNPMLVPKYQARVAALVANIPNVKDLAKVRVMLAPNEDLASQIIAAIHTGNPRRPWSPNRQAAFFQAQLDAGRKYPELVERYPTINVRKFVFRSHVNTLFKKVKYDDPELKDFLATKDWLRGLSTLERIYESKDFQELTGLTMSPRGILTTSLSTEGVKAVATIIVEGIKSGGLDTRSLNKVDSVRFKMLISELEEAVSLAGASSGSTSAAQQTSQARSGAKGEAVPAGKPSAARAKTDSTRTTAPAPLKKTQWLVIGFTIPSAYPPPISLHLQELSALDIQKYPNTTFLVLRAVLEKSIKAFAEAKGQDIGKTKNNTNGYVQLHDALKWLAEYVKTNGPRSLVQPVHQLQHGKLVNYTASSDALNAINHNHKFKVDPDEVLNCWQSIEPILRELMKP